MTSYFELHIPADCGTVILQNGRRNTHTHTHTHTDTVPHPEDLNDIQHCCENSISFIFKVLSWQRPGFNPRIVHGRLCGNGTGF